LVINLCAADTASKAFVQDSMASMGGVAGSGNRNWSKNEVQVVGPSPTRVSSGLLWSTLSKSMSLSINVKLEAAHVPELTPFQVLLLNNVNTVYSCSAQKFIRQ
jgi:hypothetical protein